MVTAAGNRIRTASIDQLLEMERPLRRPKDVCDVEERDHLKALGDELDPGENA